MRLRQTHLALALGFAVSVAACMGDDTTGSGGAGGGSTEGGTDGGTGGQGGTAGQGGGDAQAGTGGQGGTAGQGGTGATDAGARDAAPDASAETSAPDDGGVASDVRDSAAESEAGPTVCAATDGGDAQVHFQLYSFDAGAAGAADLAAWSTFNMGPIAASTDDSTPESSNPGSLHATMQYSAYGISPVLESFHQAPLDFSCFSALHISVKIASPTTYIPFVTLYVTSGAQPPGPGYYSMNLLTTNGIGDGNWHDLVAPLTGAGFTGNRSAITRIGFMLYPSTTMPDGGPATPPNLEVFIDNVWLE